jgi:beta-lactamase regulating signal transducer with metallopeptidase domain/protocatechuate 3,4-dioxygenase beta subunit/Leucine-rich repeat (LRR) protein
MITSGSCYLLAWIDPAYCLRLTQALLHVIWEGGVIAVLYAAALFFLRGASANARYAVGVVALVLMAACLPLTLLVLPSAKSEPGRELHVAASVVDSPSARSHEKTPVSADVTPEITPSSDQRADTVSVPDLPDDRVSKQSAGGMSRWLTSISPYATTAYFCGVVGMLMRLSLGLWGGRRLRLASTPCRDQALLQMVADHAHEFQLRLTPQIAWCARLVVPVVVGVLRPVILLPTILATGLTADQLRAVLLHELAHVRRYDLVVNVLQRVIEAFLFFHPAVWWISRRVSIERENACDDLVLALNYHRTQYAEALVRVAEVCATAGKMGYLAFSPGTALAATGSTDRNSSQFKRRILRLIGQDEQPQFRLSGTGLLFCTFALIALLAAPALVRTQEQPPVGAAKAIAADSSGSGAHADRSESATAAKPTDKGPSTLPDKITLSGICLDENKKPLAGVRVRLFRLPWPDDSALMETKSDRDGKFQLDNVAIDAAFRNHREYYYVVASLEGKAYAQTYWRKFESDSVELTLKKAASLTGRVTDTQGNPVAGAVVDGSLFEGVGTAVTDQNGWYEIKDVGEWDPSKGPAGGPTATSFFVSHPNYAEQTAIATKFPSRVDVMLEPPSVAEGTVIDDETGKPAAGVRVWAPGESVDSKRLLRLGAAVKGGGHTKTDEQGHYRFGTLPAGTYNIWAEPAGSNEIRSAANPWTMRAIDGLTLAVGQTVTGADLRLIKGGLIKGRVVDDATGKPVLSVHGLHMDVGVYGPARPRRDWSAAVQLGDVNHRGEFELRVPAGKNFPYLPSVRNEKLAVGAQYYEQGVEVEDGKTTEIEFRLKLKPEDEAVFSDQPEASDQRPEASKEKKPSGSLDKPPEKPMDKGATALPDKITISGICLEENKKPVADARVRLFLVNFTIPQTGGVLPDDAQRDLGQTRSDADGHFRFNDVSTKGISADGGAFFYVVGQDAERATAINSFHPLDKKMSGQPVELSLTPAASLKGRVVNDDGKPVSGAIVYTGCGVPKPVPGIQAAVTDADGRYEIADLRPFDLANQKPRPGPNGTFMVAGPCIGQVQHPDYARQPFKYSKTPDTIDVKLQRVAIIEGQVLLDQTNDPAAGVRLEFWNDNVGPDGWTRTVTDQHGHYRLATLPPGVYRMSAILKGHPNLFREKVTLRSGQNTLDLRMEIGGVIKGRLVDATTEKQITLPNDQTMSIGTCIGNASYAGMPGTSIGHDGTFTLLVPAGRNRLSMYRGKEWDGVNTDQLFHEGVEVAEGQTMDLEIRLKPHNPERDKPPQPLAPSDAEILSEQAAIAAITKLGGWTKTEKIDGQDRVIEVNMVYHEDDKLGRQDNRLISDDCLTYVRKFPKLQKLFLHREQATDAALANVEGNKTLETVLIWDASKVTDAGAAHLATLPNLKSVYVSNAQLTDEALRLFSKLPKIEDLSLQGNHFTDQGLAYVAGMTQLKRLVLGLGKNEITNDGLRHLARLTNLELLDLQDSQVTDAGLKHLVGLKKLQELWAPPAVTRQGLQELHKSLPNLKLPGDETRDNSAGSSADQPFDAEKSSQKDDAGPSAREISADVPPASSTLPDKITISGICLDENKKPLANAKVQLCLLESRVEKPDGSVQCAFHEFTPTRAGTDGRFKFTDTPTDGVTADKPFSIIAELSGRTTAVESVNPISNEGSPQPIRLIMPPGGSLKGRVTDEQGNPVAGATVFLPNPTPGIPATTTDDDGRYEIAGLRLIDFNRRQLQRGADGLPARLADAPSVEVGHPNYKTMTRALSVAPLDDTPAIEVDHPNYAKQTFRFTKVPGTLNVTVHRPAVVEGRVVLAESGEPARGAHIAFGTYSANPGWPTELDTDERGHYRLATLPPGEYALVVKLKGRPDLLRSGIKLKSGENTLDLEMKKGGTIKGRLIDARSGKPVVLPDEHILLLDVTFKDGMPYTALPTPVFRPDESFEIPAPAGHIDLRIRLGPNWEAVSTNALTKNGINIAEGETRDLEIKVKPTAAGFTAAHQ